MDQNNKTISYHSVRNKDGMTFDFGKKELTKYEAAHELLVNELGFWGQVTQITKTSVTIMTKVFHCVDTTTFSGPEEDMLLLLAAICAWQKLDHDKALDEAISVIQETVGLRPFYIVTALPLFVGQTKLQMIVNAIIPYMPPEDMCEAIFAMAISDKIAIYELLDGGATFDDIRPLLAA